MSLLAVAHAILLNAVCISQLYPGAQEMTVDMEVEFLNLGLDIIGLGVFNYEFGSITTESPVIKVQLICSSCAVPLHHPDGTPVSTPQSAVLARHYLKHDG
jgi:hypothetical protein